MTGVLSSRSASLAPFFSPHGVALIGASRDPAKLSYGVLSNLVDPGHRFSGPVYPVNPKAAEILGLTCYADIADVPDPVDLAILVIPALAVPKAVEACGRRGVKAVVVISGGFREVGPEGLRREVEMIEIASRYGMRVMGPNGIGVIDTHTPLNTTFVKGMPLCGQIAFISQSGALCGGIIDWALGRGIGFSRLLSVGNEADVNETDLLPFLAADDDSQVLALYLEDVKGGPAFRDALRQAAAVKPVLVIKAGRTAGGQLATASHTGALAGGHAAFRAVCRQSGAVEMESIEGLFDAALALAYQPLPRGGRISILTNAGGPAALAADLLAAAGLSLARTSAGTQAQLRAGLGPDVQVAGPVDLLGGADESGYGKALAALLADPDNDGVLAILVPQALVHPVAVVDAWAAAQIGQVGRRKPLLACLMGQASLAEAELAAHAHRIPAYTFPEDAVAAFGILHRRAAWLAVPHPAPRSPAGVDVGEVRALLAAARGDGRNALDAAEATRVLAAYGIPVPPDELATDPDQAAGLATRVGFPVAMKLASPDILHKTEVGGVVLGVADATQASRVHQEIVARARQAVPGARIRGVQIQPMLAGGQEVIVGMKRDPTFGPLLMFGLGGVYVEALADVSFRLAPLSAADAGEMIGEVRSARLLDGLRGSPPADHAAMEEVILRVGQLAIDFPEIAELDINPLLVSRAERGALAVDARILLQP